MQAIAISTRTAFTFRRLNFLRDTRIQLVDLLTKAGEKAGTDLQRYVLAQLPLFYDYSWIDKCRAIISILAYMVFTFFPGFEWFNAFNVFFCSPVFCT